MKAKRAFVALALASVAGGAAADGVPKLPADHVHAHYWVNGFEISEYTPMTAGRKLHIQASGPSSGDDVAIDVPDNFIVDAGDREKRYQIPSYQLDGTFKTEFTLKSVPGFCTLSLYARGGSSLDCEFNPPVIEADKVKALPETDARVDGPPATQSTGKKRKSPPKSSGVSVPGQLPPPGLVILTPSGM